MCPTIARLPRLSATITGDLTAARVLRITGGALSASAIQWACGIWRRGASATVIEPFLVRASVQYRLPAQTPLISRTDQNTAAYAFTGWRPAATNAIVIPAAVLLIWVGRTRSAVSAVTRHKILLALNLPRIAARLRAIGVAVDGTIARFPAAAVPQTTQHAVAAAKTRLAVAPANAPTGVPLAAAFDSA